VDGLATRILQVMDHYGLSKADFAQKLMISPAVLSHISSGRNKPGLELIVSLLENYSDVSADWLILGVGPMLRQKQNQEFASQISKLLDEVKLLNDMNYSSLNMRIENLKSLIQH
jgi:transcriptional regulator with XRE-family HTH domain